MQTFSFTHTQTYLNLACPSARSRGTLSHTPNCFQCCVYWPVTGLLNIIVWNTKLDPAQPQLNFFFFFAKCVQPWCNPERWILPFLPPASISSLVFLPHFALVKSILRLSTLNQCMLCSESKRGKRAEAWEVLGDGGI